MNNNDDLQIRRSFDLGKELREAGEKFAKTEEQLVREFQTRRFSESRRYQDGLATLNADLARETTAIAEKFTRIETLVRQFHEKRRRRIERAHRTASANLLKEALHAKERWIANIQIKQSRATEGLSADLEAAEEAFQGLSGRLGRLRLRLINLQRRTRQSFLGCGTFLKLLDRRNELSTERVKSSEETSFLFDELQTSLDLAKENLAAFRQFWIPWIFSLLPLPVSIPLAFAGGVSLGFFPEPSPFHFMLSGIFGAGLVAGILSLHRIGLRKSVTAAKALVSSLAEARRRYNDCAAISAARYEEERQRIQEGYDRMIAEIKNQWSQANGIERSFAENMRAKLESQIGRTLEKNELLLSRKLQRIELERDAEFSRQASVAEKKKAELAETREKGLAELTSEEVTRWEELEAAWRGEILPIYESIRAMNTFMEKQTPAWNAHLIESWVPPETFPRAVKFASINLDFSKVGDFFPKDPRLSLPVPLQVEIPLALTFPGHGSLLFETPDSGSPPVIGTLNNIILRLLTTTAPGKVTFTIVDPVGLGQNFAGLMYLSDFEETVINRRIWTQHDQIEERLDELNEHIEKVIQMYLRNEYETITQYNDQAGSVAEKYHFLVVADFPTNFSETAVKKLQSIATSGPRCGVFTLIHWDQRQPQPDGLVPEELRKNSVCIRRDRKQWFIGEEPLKAEEILVFDQPPEPQLAVDLVMKIGRSSIDSNRVEVPFAQIAPEPSELWQGETTQELKVAIGRTGATKLQYLALGRGTRQHVLIAGKTGSGKSTLFHIIITNLALTYSPEQVEFYLIDFKKGVEFKCYATHHLPHARVIAIESDREFALSVLQRVDEELKRRGDMFRKLGVQDIAGYKRAGGTEAVPRSLLIIDEFQEFFVQEDQIAQTASLLFDRIVRQGRAFGIHVLLGSQTLGGAYTLARTTLGQMVVRIALQCNEADSYLIMDDNNPAPRLLSRPGEGIYNDASGALEGNSPFQVVWLGDSERDRWLEQIHARAIVADKSHGSQIVFEGNAPADIRENVLLRSALENTRATPPSSPRCWLGAPNSIKGPTEAVFHRQGGNHLLLVGQRDEAMQTMLASSLIALAAQYPLGAAKFFLFHTSAEEGTEGDFLEEVASAIPHGVTMVQNHNLSEVLCELDAELKSRESGNAAADAPALFVFIHELQKFKKLRRVDEFDFSAGSDSAPGPDAQFSTLLTEGSSQGIHLIVTLDTLNNLNRFLSRKMMSEFEMRVVFQMSANDSASLIDSPQASSLGLHRALFYSEHDGHLETFRPYATPGREWVREAVQKLAQTHPSGRAL